MLYVDYHWDLTPTLMIPDPELNTDALQWNRGDYWQVSEINGRKVLKKVDPLVQFVLAGGEKKLG